MTVTWTWRTFNELSNNELYEILALRQAVFVVEQQCIYNDLDFKDQHAMHLLGKQAGRLCTYMRLLPKGIAYPDAVSAGRFATAISERKQGLARAAAIEAQKYLQQNNIISPVIVSAQAYLRKFYEDLGFHAVGDEYDEDGLPHIEMHKETP